MTAEFEKFPSIARLNRKCYITEKIDGTNAQVHILEDGTVLAGSRKRYVTPEQDNFGFAAWVKEHEDELRKLGPGRHYGEWWGKGIQRGYGLDHRRFSLFNTRRWAGKELPECVHLVPVLYEGDFNTSVVEKSLLMLKGAGSFAALGFDNPEGIIVYHKAAGIPFKVTLKNDDLPKSRVRGE